MHSSKIEGLQSLRCFYMDVSPVLMGLVLYPHGLTGLQESLETPVDHSDEKSAI